jgi:hypothetical protein
MTQQVKVALFIPVLRQTGPVQPVPSPTVPIPAGYQPVLDSTTVYGKTFQGSAERATITWFCPMQTFIPQVDDWIAQQCLAKFDDAIARNGGQLLRIQMFKQNINAGVSANYMAAVDADVGTVVPSSSPTSVNMNMPFPWTPVIILALVIIALIVTAVVLQKTEQIVYGTPTQPGIGNIGLLVVLGLVAYGVTRPEGRKLVGEAAKAGTRALKKIK